MHEPPFSVLIQPCYSFTDTTLRVPEAPCGISRRFRDCAAAVRGPDCLGSGSVGGFGGLVAGDKSYSLGALKEQLHSYWNAACVRVCIWNRDYLAPGGIPDSLDGESKQTGLLWPRKIHSTQSVFQRQKQGIILTRLFCVLLVKTIFKQTIMY